MVRSLSVLAAATFAVGTGWPVQRLAQPASAGQVTPARPPVPGRETAKGTAVIRGTVVAMDTGLPLRRVQVRAFGNTPDNRSPRVSSTDDQGRFELRDLQAGRYIVYAAKAGFVSLQFGQRRPNERGTPVEVTDGQSVDKVTIALPRGGVITGRLSDDAGEPIADVLVQVFRYGYTSAGRRPVPARGDRTDDTGAFRVFGLPPGDYYLSAKPNESQMTMADARLATGDSDHGFAPTYYPGTPSLTDAERITLGVGQEVSGLHFGLTPTRLSRVSGRVVGWTDTRGPAWVSATPDEDMTGSGMIPPVEVQPEGDFELRGLAPGRYVLQAQPRGRREDEPLIGTTNVTVSGADLANVTIAMQRPGRIRGRVELEGGAPAAIRPAQVQVYLEPLNTSGRGVYVGAPEVADDFTFTARVGSGSWLLRSSTPGWYLKAVEADGQDLTDTPLTVAPGAELAGVRLLLTQTASKVTGVVRNDRGDVVVDAAVIVFPDDYARWTFMSRHIRAARPDTEGRFELVGLPPSPAYRIVAVTAIEDGQAYDPEFLSSVRDRADRLSLNEGEGKAVELRLRP